MRIRSGMALIGVVLVFVFSVTAQTTAFTYQGSLKNGASAANGNYDFEFKLFDAASGGAQQGSAIQRVNVAVANGIFSVSLDFGAAPLPGADRFLEVGVRTGGNPGGFQQLLPRQKVNSTPYALRSLNAATADSVAANGIPAGSGNYIQNTASPQASSNFNVSGSGTVGGTLSGNVVNTATQYNIGGARVLSIPGQENVFAGVSAGAANTTGSGNAFFGKSAGVSNTSGFGNSFLGLFAGTANTSGANNSFFGAIAGDNNTTGGGNSFFGSTAGAANSTGADNSFFGRNAGTFNASGSNNTAIGVNSGFTANDLTFATAIGSQAKADLSNSVYLGRPGGEDTVRIPGNLNITGSTTMNGNLVFASGNIALFSSPITLTSLGTAGGTALCRNGSNQIANCSSSLRYKTNIAQFSQGMSFVDRLRPISFDWKDGGMNDVGFGAEDIARIDPRFVTYNDKGEVEGVKYDRLSAAFVNAFKEQQAQIEGQKKQIEALTQALCSLDPALGVCKPKEK